MKQEVSLNKQEVNQAILEYAEKHGVRLDGMVATVEVVATRGDRELFATIALEPQTNDMINIPKKELDQMIHEVSDAPIVDEGVPVEVEPSEDDVDPETRAFS